MQHQQNTNKHSMPDERGYYGSFGGRYMPETLMPAVEELAGAYHQAKADPEFARELDYYLANYVGRPSPLYYATGLTNHLGGAQIYLKREDLNHTGSHKINNTMGQILLARRMGKKTSHCRNRRRPARRGHRYGGGHVWSGMRGLYG